MTEIKKIKEIDLGERKSLKRVRDIFLFSCYTGLRYQDAQSLTYQNISIYDNKQKYLNITTQKTSERISIPLTSGALMIIHEYSGNNSEKILPQLSNQKFNVHIKTLAKLCGIEKKISHHTARHTFATTALNNGIPITVVQKLLGHASVNTTEIYAKTLQSTIFSEMQKME